MVVLPSNMGLFLFLVIIIFIGLIIGLATLLYFLDWLFFRHESSETEDSL